jgi:hypothetical protein
MVEGSSDHLLYKKFFNSKIKIESMGGLTLLLSAFDELESDARVFVIRDSDYLRFEYNSDNNSYAFNPIIETKDRVFVTDANDGEMMMLQNLETFKNVASEFVTCVTDDETAARLRDYLINCLKPFGLLRLINNKKILKLQFECVQLSSFCKDRKFSFDLKTCLHTLSVCNVNKVVPAIAEIKAIEHLGQVYDICRGHDFAKVLGLISDKEKGVSGETIETSLRVAYRFEDFAMTKLYKEVSAWGKTTEFELFQRRLAC